jgi:transcription elongation factor Elf1
MTKEIEQIEIQTTCPICNKTISELWIAKLDSVIGIRYVYICTNCKNLIKITKEKYLDTANLNQILFSQSSTA